MWLEKKLCLKEVVIAMAEANLTIGQLNLKVRANMRLNNNSTDILSTTIANELNQWQKILVVARSINIDAISPSNYMQLPEEEE